MEQYGSTHNALIDLLTSFSQLLHNVMERSNSICRISAHIIPNQSPYIFRSEFRRFLQLVPVIKVDHNYVKGLVSTFPPK
jgi:hypothetical protein